MPTVSRIPPSEEAIMVVIPADLLHFARACAGADDISECVVAALELLRARIDELAAAESPN
jgi:hypothetical protein